ncbi:MAG: YdcF family protein [Bacteroidota bacterium]
MRLSFYLLIIIITFITSSCGLINHAANNTGKDYLINAPYDAIIVPGLPFSEGKVNTILKARILWAKWLFERKVAKNIIFSGSAVHSPYVEAKAMKIMADSLGIPSNHTFMETRAEHGTENIDFGIQLAHQLGFKKVAIATDPFQSLFLKKFTQKSKYNVALIPFPLQLIRVYHKQKIPGINSTEAFVKDFVPLEKRDVAQKE